MQLKTLFVPWALPLGLTNALFHPSASDSPCADPNSSAFGLIALRSAGDIHLARFSAARRSLLLNFVSQNATCDRESDGTATFYLKDGGLNLYSTNNPPHQIFVDRSGMGQGKVGYMTGSETPPRNAELTGWAFDENDNLTLKGARFIACPGRVEGSWSVWINAGIDQPAGNEGCLGFNARAEAISNPNSCLYSQ